MVVINFSGYQITNTTASVLMGVVSNQINKQVEEITLLINSPGGTVNDGIALYNFLKGVPIELTVHNIGQVDSIANIVFMAGKHRFAVPTSSFFFHDVGMTVKKELRLVEKNLNEHLKIIKRDRQKIIDVLTAESKITSEQLNELFLNSDSIQPDKAKEYDIIHDIKPIEIPKKTEVLTLNISVA